MTLHEAEKLLRERWMILSQEERLLVCAGLYEAEKAILERLAPDNYSEKELLEFVFYHMHGMTVQESIRYVPDSIP